jgi:hypothetical protein
LTLIDVAIPQIGDIKIPVIEEEDCYKIPTMDDDFTIPLPEEEPYNFPTIYEDPNLAILPQDEVVSVMKNSITSSGHIDMPCSL